MIELITFALLGGCVGLLSSLVIWTVTIRQTAPTPSQKRSLAAMRKEDRNLGRRIIILLSFILVPTSSILAGMYCFFGGRPIREQLWGPLLLNVGAMVMVVNGAVASFVVTVGTLKSAAS